MSAPATPARTKATPAARRRAQRGIALVLVLWLTVLLTAIAGGFAYSMRTEALAAGNAIAVAKVRAAADGAIDRTAFELTRPRVPGAWAPNGAEHAWRDGEIEIAVRATDETAKIDLNAASEILLRGLLTNVGGADPDTAAGIVDAILDWRDPDDQRRQFGAERREYERESRVGPRNGPFATVEELRQVLGVTPELYRRLEPIVTVACLQSGIDTRVAPLAALRAVPGIRDREVEEVAALRRRSLDRGDPLPTAALSGIQRYASQSPGFAYSILSVARLESGAESRLEAQVWLLLDGERPYALLGLRDGRGVMATIQAPPPATGP